MPLPAPPSGSRRRFLTPLLLLLLALVGTGCEDDPASPASVTVRYREQAPLTRDRLVVTVDDERSGWYFEGVDFQPSADGWLTSRTLRVSGRGGVRMTISLRGTGVAAAASGEVVLPEGLSDRWLVDVFASEDAPSVACDGCTGLARFPIAEDARPTARDWLYVRWDDAGARPPPD